METLEPKTKPNFSDEVYINFQNLLKYFVAHLEVYNAYKSKKEIDNIGKWENLTPKTEYDGWTERIEILKKIKGRLDEFKWTGQGFKGGTIEKQIENWNTYPNFMRIGISVRADSFNFNNKGIYLHWLGTSVNIKAAKDENNDGQISRLFIVNNNQVSNIEIGINDVFQQELNTNLTGFFDKYWEMGKDALNKQQYYVDILEAHHNLILTGAPGTGKTYMAHQIAKTIVEKDKNLGEDEYKSHIEFVQFHPSYDYTDFVEGLRPVQQGQNIVFKWHAGHFMNLCIKAAKNKDSKYVIIIDEINRGEINKIFGELFFSIDPEYRGGHPIRTQYADCQPKKVNDDGYEDNNNGTDNPFKGNGFYVPANVYIIGTMNDIDRSVESFDFALRRRFAWEEVGWKDTIGQILAAKFKNEVDKDTLEKQKEIYGYFERLNSKIEAKEFGLGSAYCLGGSYISKLPDKEEVIADIQEAMKNLWDRFLKNIIKDYVRGLDGADSLYDTLYKAYIVEQGIHK